MRRGYRCNMSVDIFVIRNASKDNLILDVFINDSKWVQQDKYRHKLNLFCIEEKLATKLHHYVFIFFSLINTVIS